MSTLASGQRAQTVRVQNSGNRVRDEETNAHVLLGLTLMGVSVAGQLPAATPKAPPVSRSGGLGPATNAGRQLIHKARDTDADPPSGPGVCWERVSDRRRLPSECQPQRVGRSTWHARTHRLFIPCGWITGLRSSAFRRSSLTPIRWMGGCQPTRGAERKPPACAAARGRDLRWTRGSHVVGTVHHAGSRGMLPAGYKNNVKILQSPGRDDPPETSTMRASSARWRPHLPPNIRS